MPEPAQNLLFGFERLQRWRPVPGSPKANPVPFPSCLYQGYLQFYTIPLKGHSQGHVQKVCAFHFLGMPRSGSLRDWARWRSRPSERAPAPPRGTAPPVGTGVPWPAAPGTALLSARLTHALALTKLEMGNPHPQQLEDPGLAPPECSRWFQRMPGQNLNPLFKYGQVEWRWG